MVIFHSCLYVYQRVYTNQLYINVYSDIFAGAAFSCLCILRRSAFKLFLVLNRTQQHRSVADQRKMDPPKKMTAEQ
jgi:hypothetical protein